MIVKMIISQKDIWLFLLVFFIIFNITSACRRRKRKACNRLKNEVYSTCASPCKQMNCNDLILNVTDEPYTTECQPGCICKLDYVRRQKPSDPCVLVC